MLECDWMVLSQICMVLFLSLKLHVISGFSCLRGSKNVYVDTSIVTSTLLIMPSSENVVTLQVEKLKHIHLIVC